MSSWTNRLIVRSTAGYYPEAETVLKPHHLSGEMPN